MYVCVCKAVTTGDVIGAISSGAEDPDALVAKFEWDDPACCGNCLMEAPNLAKLASRYRTACEPAGAACRAA